MSHADEFKQLHEYYTTRSNNPLKKMQSLVVIACKILRVIYTILKTGTTYDSQKLLKDIKYPVSAQAAMGVLKTKIQALQSRTMSSRGW